jgi:MoaD family protein
MPTIKLYANLRLVAGTKETYTAGANIREVLSELVLQHPALASYVLENEQIRSQLIITINGQPTKDMDTPVIEQDQIAIFPPISGGCFDNNKEIL